MSNDLAIGGPGAVSVVTTKLENASRHLEGLNGDLGALRRQLVCLDRTVTAAALRAGDAPFSAFAAERSIDDAQRGLERCAGTSEHLARSLAEAARRYTFADAVAAWVARSFAALFGYELGFLLPVLAVLALPGVSAVGSALALRLATMPEDRRGSFFRGVSGWAQAHQALLSDPHVVELVRLTVMSADDFGEGALHVPLGRPASRTGPAAFLPAATKCASIGSACPGKPTASRCTWPELRTLRSPRARMPGT